MPRTCTICASPKRNEIDSALIDGGTLRDIAGRFKVSKSAVDRHRAHITALVQAHTAEVAETLDSHISKAQGRAESLYAAAEEVLQGALKVGNAAAVLQSVRTACHVLSEARALAELRGAREPASSADTTPIDEEIERFLAARDAELRAAVIAEMQGGPPAEIGRFAGAKRTKTGPLVCLPPNSANVKA